MKYIDKNITSVDGPAIIAHGVNCSNTMGRGVAKALYTRWPAVKEEYHAHGSMELMDAQFVRVASNIIVVNCFTQRSYGNDGAKYAVGKAIDQSLREVAGYALFTKLDVIHIPKIGAGLGGLDWEKEVVPVLEKIEADSGVEFVVCSL